MDQKHKYMAHFTNYTNSIQMYFEERSELLRLKAQISKYVTQVKFNTRFETMDTLGEGSFAKVFLAKKKNEGGQEYAVKMVSKLDRNKNKNRESVEQERLALETLNN